VESSDNSFFEFGSCDSFSDDEECEIHRGTNFESTTMTSMDFGTAISTPINRTRHAHGIDTKKTARYRLCNFENSAVYQYLKSGDIEVTKKSLSVLVNAVLKNIFPSLRPPPPTRSQKQAKVGLISWLECNVGEVLNFLAQHPDFH
jgi:hypothetical protein